MPSKEGPELGPESEETIRIRDLIERKEAVDIRDAQEALREEKEAEIYREMTPEEVLPEIRERLANPETPPAVKWDLNFRLAVIETAQAPEERVYLLYNDVTRPPFRNSARRK